MKPFHPYKKDVMHAVSIIKTIDNFIWSSLEKPCDISIDAMKYRLLRGA